MNDFKFVGELEKIFEVKEGTAKATGNSWKAVEFVVKEPSGDYPQRAKFKLFGEEKVDKFLQYNKIGSSIEVSFNLKANDYKGDTYTSLDAWKVFKADEASSSVAQHQESDRDDLPF